MIFPVLLAKFLSAGAVAQAATGAGLVLVAVSGVGAVGALPPTAQDAFATVVAAATPLEAPGSGEQTEAVAAEQAVQGDAETDEGATGIAAEDHEVVEARVEEWIRNGPDGEPFGAWVSEGSKDDVKDWLRAHDMTFGNVVSAWANGDGLSDEQLEALFEADAEGPGVQAPALVEDAPAAVVTDTGSRGSSDKAQGQGQGQTKSQTKSQTKAQTKTQTQGPAQGNGRGNG